ncbi:hypothetical protein WJX84_010740 [Apatococcus fuscideae]|uniref:Uncharacterized protein n=1 Tax=Apatococcus fuscideae TaxID=2026836 RepID=A0AAW1SPF0_9CHLO
MATATGPPQSPQVRLLQLADKAAGQKGFLDCGAGLCQWPAYRISVQAGAIAMEDCTLFRTRRWKEGSTSRLNDGACLGTSTTQQQVHETTNTL